MRFGKGSIVEVLTRNEVPTGAWRCAEIISGNGHTFVVNYGWFPVTYGASSSVERVPRKVIRPCPPPINWTDDWVPGDVVELFDGLCWIPAVIVRVFGGNFFSVRIIGSNSVLRAHQSRLRVRQSWEDGKWFLVGKGSSNSSGPSKRKRSSLGVSDAGRKKTKVIEQGSIGGQRLIVRLPCPASPKVDAFSRNDATMSCASSVGSCSGLRNTVHNLSPSYATKGCKNLEDYCSDADSSSERTCGEEGNDVSHSTTDFHMSELHAYQRSLAALHASGPIRRKGD